MNPRNLLSILFITLFATAIVYAQAAKPWVVPRTPDGQPDLQGTWTTSTLTPLERPAEFAGEPVLTEQEGHVRIHGQ